MQFPRDTDYIAQVIKELFDQGLFPIWEGGVVSGTGFDKKGRLPY